MERLQEAVKLAAKMHEESWNGFNGYSKTKKECADEAAEQLGFDERGTFPIYALMVHCWNEALDWADNK